jgi:hypothetical protein
MLLNNIDFVIFDQESKMAKFVVKCLECSRPRHGRFRRCFGHQSPRFAAAASRGWNLRRRHQEARTEAVREPAPLASVDLDALMGAAAAAGERALNAALAITKRPHDDP